jgi:metal-dependent amidase/aminoacylase/carboxypeptidase family protein
MALGDAEALSDEREVLIAASQADNAKNPNAKPAELQKRKEKLDADLAKLASKQKRRTTERRLLLKQVLAALPEFVTTRRFGVSGDARRLAAIAYRELGQYDKALKNLDPQLYKDAKPSAKLFAAQELPITLTQKGAYGEVASKISDFRALAEDVLRGKKAKLKEDQQAQIDLRVAMLKEYLARRQTAASTTDQERKKHIVAGQTAMIEFLDKYEDNDDFKRAFIDFFGNRLLYSTDMSKLSSVQLYIAASGAAAEDEPEKRRDMLEMLLSRKDDPAVKKLAPEAYWQLAMTMNQLTRSLDAADNFMLAFKAFGPDHPKAPTAAKNASLCMDKYVTWYETAQKRSAPREARLKFITAIQAALKYETKNPELKLSEWYYTLGRQCRQLAQESNAKEATAWMKRAADAFAKVPADPPAKYLSAQDLWLDLRYRALGQGELDAAGKAEARKLRADYATFIKTLEKHIATLTDPAEVRSFNNVAAWCDFTRVKLLGDQLNQSEEALTEVVAVMKKWPAVEDMMTQAIQWKIQNLVDQGQIVPASAELQAYMKKNPAAVANLIEQVIDGIKKAIAKAVRTKAPAAKLASLRTSYLQLAKGLYDTIKGKPIVEGAVVHAQRLKLTQLWIDALIQNDRAAEAMTLAAECRRIFNAGREAKCKIIDSKYAKVLSKCKAAIGLPAALDNLVKGYIAELNARAKDKGYDDFNPAQDSSAVLLAQKAIKAYKGDDKDKKRRLQSTLSLELRTGYREIMRRLKSRIPVDLMVEWDIAKCYAATGKYNESLKIYARLIKGTPPRGDANMKRRFWRLNLEYCQTFLKALSEDKVQMGKLVVYIEVELTKIGGAEKGGFKAEFFAIQEKARRLSK